MHSDFTNELPAGASGWFINLNGTRNQNPVALLSRTERPNSADRDRLNQVGGGDYASEAQALGH